MRTEGHSSHLPRLELNQLTRQIPRRRAVPKAAMGILQLHLIFEYLRLHQMFPIIGSLKIQTAITVALIFIVISQTGKRGVRLARQSWLLLGFLGLSAFTILVATNNYYAYQFTYGMTLTLAGFFAITHILQNERDLNKFLATLAGIHIYIAARVVLNYKASFTRSGYLTGFAAGSNFLGDENDVALAMILILPLAFYLFRRARSVQGRLFWGAGIVAIFLSIIFTFSRGGFVGLIIMMLCWAWASKNRVKAIGGLVLAGVILIAIAPERYWARMETITDISSGTAQVRRNYWAAARRMFYDSPIWGVGGNNFGVLLPEYGLEFSPDKRDTRWGKPAHSMYFELLAQFGLLGVFFIGWVLVCNFRDLREVIALNHMGRCPPAMGDLARYLRLSWVGFLVPAAFLSVLTYPHLYYLTALTVVVHRLALADSVELEIEAVGTLQEA